MGEKQIPVTLLAGFLGSGKTTLLNHVLSQNHGKRIAVIENEFGDIPVDHDLILGVDEDIFEMSNGCICCSVRTDLIETLHRLIERQGKFDSILIEATGLASPGPLAQLFLVEDELPTTLFLDAVVTVVDCVHIEKQLEELDVAWEQIAFSNVLLLNKVDLVSLDLLERVRLRLREINPVAACYDTQHAVVDLEKILDIGGFVLDPNQSLEIPGGHQHSHRDQEDINSVSLEFEGVVDEYQFQNWLQMLLITEGMDIFRAKGFLNVNSQETRQVFQSVYMMYDSAPGAVWEDGPRFNRMVFIGRGLDKDRIAAGVQTCLVG